MPQEDLLDRLSVLGANEIAMNELCQAKSRRTLLHTLSRNGCELTDADIAQIDALLPSEKEELSESALEMVSGGNVSNAWRALSVILTVMNTKIGKKTK